MPEPQPNQARGLPSTPGSPATDTLLTLRSTPQQGDPFDSKVYPTAGGPFDSKVYPTAGGPFDSKVYPTAGGLRGGGSSASLTCPHHPIVEQQPCLLAKSSCRQMQAGAQQQVTGDRTRHGEGVSREGVGSSDAVSSGCRGWTCLQRQTRVGWRVGEATAKPFQGVRNTMLTARE